MKWLRATVAAICAFAPGTKAQASEQAVIVHFQYGSTDLHELHALEDRLEKVIAAAKVGDLDGDEIAVDGSDGYLYMYGPNADHLYDAVLPVLKSAQFMDLASVTRRYGPAKGDSREVTSQIWTPAPAK